MVLSIKRREKRGTVVWRARVNKIDEYANIRTRAIFNGDTVEQFAGFSSSKKDLGSENF